MSKRKSQNKKEKQTSKKEKLGFFDDFLEHPNINSGLLGLLGTAYFSASTIIQAIQQDMLPEFLSENGLRMGLSWATLSIIARGAIMPFSKFKTPKAKNFLRFMKLEDKLKKEYSVLKKENKLQEELSKLHSCFGENVGYYYLAKSEIMIQNGDYEEGLDDLVSYLRIGKTEDLGVRFKPISLLSELIFSIPKYISIKYNNNSYEQKRRSYYSLISNQLFHSVKSKRAAAIAHQINSNFKDIGDKLAYGNIMNYLDGPKKEHWEPFFSKLTESLASEHKTIEDVIDMQSDTRNKVINYKNIYLKEYTQDDESLSNELKNINHFAKLPHTVSKVLEVHFGDKKYLLSPYSGDVLEDKIDNLERSKREEILRKALKNLAEIQTLGMELNNKKADQRHYSKRIEELSKGYLNHSLEFLSAYDDAISSKITTLDVLYYKDHNIKNILIDEGEVKEIDFENNILKPPGIDVISALEFSDYYDELFSREALKEYYSIIKPNISSDFDEFEKQHQYLRVQRHLEFPGYRLRSGLVSAVPFQINLALDALRKITKFDSNNQIDYMIEYIENNLKLDC